MDTSNLTTDTYSSTLTIEHIIGYSFHLVYTGDTTAMTADVVLQASNTGTGWADIAPVTQIVGTNTDLLLNISDPYYKYVRLAVENISGTITTATAYVYAKGLA